jgi:dTDP-4-amino-4,6-dideoxygalactose transaminase
MTPSVTTLTPPQNAAPNRIYLSPPHMSAEGYELDFVHEAFNSNWIAPIGPHVSAFEEEFARDNGPEHAAALSCGTAAIHLALYLLGVGPGDEILCSSFTFCASANPAVYLGARPVFIDSDEATWTMDPALLAAELRRRALTGKLPKAIVVVDLYGQSADYDSILPICDEYNVPVIEDAAEALGSTYRGVRTGNFGAFGVFSFNGNKIITGSSGGMLVSKYADWITKVRVLATQARSPAPYYEHEEIGFNYRISNVIAGILRGQLRILPNRVARKREIFQLYRARLDRLPGIRFMPEAPYGQSNCWLTCLTIDPAEFGATSDDVRLALEAHNIESRPLWKPLHLQPVFRDCRTVGGEVSARLFQRGLCLPSGTALTDSELDRVMTIIEHLAQK